MVVHPHSHGVSRVPRYSGYSLIYIGFRLRGSHPLWPAFPCRSTNLVYRYVSPNPEKPEGLSVWPSPRSLATTSGISVDVFSSTYLDVSVRWVPFIYLWIQYMIHGHYSMWVSPFGNLRINAYLPLPAAYRSLSRPSSAPSAKAFSLRPFLLDYKEAIVPLPIILMVLFQKI